MTDEHWQLAYAIYEAAAPLGESERSRYVHATAPDREIASKVLAMLDEMEAAADLGALPDIAHSEGLVTASPSSSLPNGAALGRFVITGIVGRGGMGIVYSAHDPELNREVALKVIAHEAGFSSPERFIHEAQAASALNHPNIVTVYEVIRSGSTVAIAMELVTGTSLRHFCGTTQPLGKLALWGGQIARALAAAHAHGIVHRDIKPDNLMLRPDGYIKVLDFGLARQVGVDRADDELALGTLGYMSPEQVLRQPITAASDIFSLGVVLYELASGTNPFRAGSAAATTRLIQGLEVPPLPAQREGVPRKLDHLVRVMLSKSATDRPAASEVVLRFEALAQPRTFRRRNRSKPAHRQPSIAVLPFANMSSEKEQEYFSDGLAEEIINGLARVPGINVTARTSAFSFKGKDVQVAEIAHELGVEHILEGSVRKAGNRIRITAHLIRTSDGFHLWSERFDRELNDIFAVQNEISAAIAGALQVKLVASPAVLRSYTPKLPAYDAYLKGLHQYAKLAPDSLAKARESFEQAIALDPEYALPRSALGANFATLGVYGMRPAHDVMPLARRASQEALSLDPSLPEAHANLGLVAGLYNYDWKEAGRLFRTATARDPVPPQARQWHSLYLLALGRAEDAIEEAGRALEEDPLNLSSRAVLVTCLHAAGRDEEAAAEAHRTLEFDENQFSACGLLSFIEASRGKLAEALFFAERGYSLAPWTKLQSGLFAGLLMRTDETGRADAVLAKLGDGRSYRSPLGFAFYHLVQGQVEQAADWAEKCIEQRDPGTTYFLRLPLAAALRSSARWPVLTGMMNLPAGVS